MARTIPVIALVFFLLPAASGQAPFVCEGQAFVIREGTGELSEMSIDPANNGLRFLPVNANLGVAIEALGFRATDRLLYGIGRTSRRLYRIDANGLVEDLGLLPLDNSLAVIGGAISPDGRYFAAIAQGAGGQSLAKVGLDSPGFATTFLSLPASRRIIDIAFNPLDNRLFGYDADNRCILTINFDNGSVAAFNPIEAGNEIQGLFFNPFGELLAYGSSIFGVASALFRISQANGREVRAATGPVFLAADAAACPYSVAMRSEVSPGAVFPCSELRYTYTIGNSSGQAHSGVTLEQEFPEGFGLVSILRNPFGGTLSGGGPPNRVRLENMAIPRRVDSLVLLMEAGDVPGGNYPGQAALSGLPGAMGGSRVSDNPATLSPDDSTAVLVNRFAEDSLYFSNFLCLGSSLTLDAGAYGNNLLWSTGSTSAEISVTQQGAYHLQAFSGCQALSVTYEVTVASCPFTVELGHKIVPAETFPCQEVVFRYIIDNDSGLPRSGVSLSDTLPAGFAVVGLERNPFGGELQPGLPPEILNVHNMSLPVGIDSIEVAVELGPVPPGIYRQRAVLSGLPPAIGPTRLSVNADTMSLDSTSLQVFGAGSDSTYLDAVLCPNETLALDGSPYGTSFLWEDGSTRARLPVAETGSYQLAVFNGCEPSFVFFNVVAGPLIELEMPGDTIRIHLGEEVQLAPTLTNLGSTLELQWDGPAAEALSCRDCLAPAAKPLDNAVYTLRAANELCADTLEIAFVVDKSRRIYAPNAFSPNRDGVNDYFILQSPDFGIIRSLAVYDRWGGLVFQSPGAVMNQAASGWDGTKQGKPVPEGLYLWKAEIEFIGEIMELFSGEVAVLR